MSKTDELKKLSEKLVGSAPDTRKASSVVEYIADQMSGDSENTDTISQSIAYLTKHVQGGGGGDSQELLNYAIFANLDELTPTSNVPSQLYHGYNEITYNIDLETNTNAYWLLLTLKDYVSSIDFSQTKVWDNNRMPMQLFLKKNNQYIPFMFGNSYGEMEDDVYTLSSTCVVHPTFEEQHPYFDITDIIDENAQTVTLKILEKAEL